MKKARLKTVAKNSTPKILPPNVNDLNTADEIIGRMLHVEECLGDGSLDATVGNARSKAVSVALNALLFKLRRQSFEARHPELAARRLTLHPAQTTKVLSGKKAA